ncbi:MAG: Carbohydrate binding domain (family 25) [Firmicutes bacterium]|nr:Carbohydrate binding domain (family 25) [Bacillota bacterium]
MPRPKKTSPEVESDAPILDASTTKIARRTKRVAVGATSLTPSEAKATRIIQKARPNEAAEESYTLNTAEGKARRKTAAKAEKTIPSEVIAKADIKSKTVRKYKSNGVLLSLEVPPVYAPVRISYDGLLAQNGATELYAHAGIGTDWDNTQEVKMAKTKSGMFEATVLAAEESILNVCFRDAAYNWDNNSEANYVFSVT